MKKNLKQIFIILLIGFIFIIDSGCKTTQNTEYKSKNYILENYNEAIKNNEESTALYYYFLNNTLNKNQLENKLINLIKSNFNKSIKSDNLFLLYREYNNLKYFNIDKTEEVKSFIINLLKKENNYYFFNSYLNFIKIYLPDIFLSIDKDIQQIKGEHFKNISFITSYKQLSKILVTVFNDKGLTIKNGAYYPDISLGTGFFIDYSLVLTNNHVISSKKEEYSKLYIEIDNNKYNANVIFKDEKYDLAILQVDFFNKNFKYLKVNNKLEIGDTVVACGSPAGLDKTFTKGIISNTKRKLLELTEVYQTDVAINPGNSGGPVVDSNFNLVGIAFAGLPQFQNINFVLPISIFNQISFLSRKFSSFQRSWLGLYIDNKLTCRYIYPKSILQQNQNIILDSKILSVNNYTNFNDSTQLQKYISLIPYGSIIKIEFSNFKTVFPVLPRPEYPLKTLITFENKNNLYIPLFGVKVEKIDKLYKIVEIYEKQFNFQLGIEKGDIIRIASVKIDNKTKTIIIKLYVKYYSKGGIETNIILYSTFDSSNFI